ncbi:MAG: lysoplasmalogenase [Myxococcota bacterium]|nr:lysoplasmalogenase [Myxococcota bacterium]
MGIAGACMLVTVVAMAGMIEAERQGSALARAVTKITASSAFVAAAVFAGAFDSRYGTWVLVALVLSWVGDVCLLPKARAWFLAGLVSFLLGHLAFAVAFVIRGFDPRAVVVALALMMAPAVVVGRWLLPRVEAAMRGPVLAYMAVITSMVTLAAATVALWGNGVILAAAVAFYLSDLAVARDRFVAPGFRNRLWGLPLYYGAQLLFVWTVSLEAPIVDGFFQQSVF